ncbi:MAG: hypothetical protein U9Q81_05240 [Pseudomonadota bacterium]|nr:hypothetical protein [Pseudomonadota bacterium]
MTSTKLTLLLILLSCATASVGAASCIDQARAVARRIQTEVAPNLNQEQLARVAAISAELCRGETRPPPSAAGNAAGPGTHQGYSDWFTYFMFEHSGDKAGNKRLLRLKR